MAWRIGVDIGGTFTDVALVDDASGEIGVAKAPTTPRDFAEGVLAALEQAMARYGVAAADVGLLSHATTVVTNALLEEKGARAAVVMTRGFRDVLELRRSARPDLYDLFQDAPKTLAPRRRRFEITERVGADGAVVTPLAEAEIDDLIVALKADKVEAVAVSLLYSFLNADHERRLGERLRAALDVPVYLSSEVLPEIREFERASTTAVCAYVGPILASYLERLETATTGLGLPRMYVMGSNGGVFEAAEGVAMPAMAVESGPAAGVVAAALAARQAGRPNLLTFDMGGTTAKASLILDGQYETTPEYEVGGGASAARWMNGVGHPIRVPVIDLAEVSAGGGSIAWTDAAGGLRVGPQSAGAEPGPVCYGRGGTEPTVTDCNLILGNLDKASLLAGEMEIDFDAAERAVREKLADPLGLTVEAAAAAVIDVVNHAMAEALKIVSVERGHDPRDFTLAAFGGAGPLHAAALAEELGVAEVICPPIPGAFSALGLVGSDLKRDYVRTVYVMTDSADPAALETAFAELEAEGAAMLDRAGVAPERRRFERSLDARYGRQSYELNVPAGAGAFDAAALAAAANAFHDRHRQTYGHDNRTEPAQIVSLRLAAIGEIPSLAIRQAPASSGDPVKGRRAVHAGRSGRADAPVLDRQRMPAGYVVDGPAVIESLESTIRVPPGWRAEMDGDGFIRLTLREKAPVAAAAQDNDPATFEIVKNSLYKIAEEMRVVLAKTAYSPILKSAGDYSCGVFDRAGDMVAQGPDLPIHLGSMPDAVRAVVQAFGDDVHDGDVFIHNDPYFGGSHLPDVNVVRPAFYKGVHLGFTCLRAHWPDVGSATPGSYGAVTEIYGEGLRLPPVRLYAKGELNAGLEAVILANVRTPEERRGDLGSQLAATLRASQRLQALAERYGAERLVAYMGEVMDYSDRLMRAALRDLPDGEGFFEDFCDGDGIPDAPDGSDAPFWVRMKIAKSGERIVVDFAGTDAQVAGPMNAALSVSASGVYCGLKTAIDPNSLIPPNSGCWRAIEVQAPKGTVVNAEFPAPVVYSNHEMSHRTADMSMAALAAFMPDQVMACSQGTSAVLTLGGVDPRSGGRYVSYETVKGGFGARPNKDGINVVASGISNTMNTPVEVLEMAFPVRVERYQIEPDSGGAGRYRGGAGARRTWRLLEGADATGALCMERMTSPPFGLLGGAAGIPATVTLTAPGAAPRRLPSKGAFHAPGGSVVDMVTPGSGGFGPTSARDPAAIGRDLLDGYVTPEAAKAAYGVGDPASLAAAAKKEDSP